MSLKESSTRLVSGAAWIYRLSLLGVGLTIACSARVLATPPSDNSLIHFDSVWIDSVPEVGREFKVSASFWITSPHVDSLRLVGFCLDAYGDTTREGMTSTSIETHYPETVVSSPVFMKRRSLRYLREEYVVRSLSFTLTRPGLRYLVVDLLSWMAYDEPRSPRGTRRIFRLDVPESGQILLLDRIPPKPHPSWQIGVNSRGRPVHYLRPTPRHRDAPATPSSDTSSKTEEVGSAPPRSEKAGGTTSTVSSHIRFRSTEGGPPAPIEHAKNSPGFWDGQHIVYN